MSSDLKESAHISALKRHASVDINGCDYDYEGEDVAGYRWEIAFGEWFEKKMRNAPNITQQEIDDAVKRWANGEK
jgi:DNA topoisomerase IA